MAGLFISALFQTIITVLAFAFCIISATLEAFFESAVFVAYSIFTCLQGIFYAGVLGFLSFPLIRRYTNFAETSVSQSERQVFRVMLWKIGAILTVTALYLILRLLFLLLGFFILRGDLAETEVSNKFYDSYCVLYHICLILCFV